MSVVHSQVPEGGLGYICLVCLQITSFRFFLLDESDLYPRTFSYYDFALHKFPGCQLGSINLLICCHVVLSVLAS